MQRHAFSAHGFELKGLSETDPYVGHLIAMTVPEPHLMNFLAANCPPSTTRTIADVGANIGFTSLLMARAYPNAEIHAFEPGPNVFELMRENIDGRNVDPVHAAVSDRSGTAYFSENSAFGHVAQSGVEVPMICLGDYADSRGIDSFDFVKVDVEGFERNVFRGLFGRAKIVFFELNAFTLNCYGRVNPMDFLEEVGGDWDLYEFLSTDELGSVTDVLATVHRNMVSSGCVTDLVAVPRGSVVVTDLANAVPVQSGVKETLPSSVEEVRIDPEVQELRAELAAVYGSASWRLTSPLRTLNAAVRRR